MLPYGGKKVIHFLVLGVFLSSAKSYECHEKVMSKSYEFGLYLISHPNKLLSKLTAKFVSINQAKNTFDIILFPSVSGSVFAATFVIEHQNTLRVKFPQVLSG